MRVIARSTLEAYWEKHAETEQPLKAWYSHARKANWTSPLDVKNDLPRASIIANNRVVFDIHGGDYRLIVAFIHETGFAFVKFVGKHSEYDKIDATTVELT